MYAQLAVTSCAAIIRQLIENMISDQASGTIAKHSETAPDAKDLGVFYLNNLNPHIDARVMQLYGGLTWPRSRERENQQEESRNQEASNEIIQANGDTLMSQQK